MHSRILRIYADYGQYIVRLVPLRVEDEYLKVVVYFADGSNLRVTEEWEAVCSSKELVILPGRS
jgi:hypothetical protein